jgi:uncharacterized protein YbjT (DUF2867 family)
VTEQTGPVLVIGATGQQGGAVARALLARGLAVRAFVRDTDRPAARALRDAGAALAVGDLDDRASLRSAMTGASGAFLVLTMMTGPYVTLDGVKAEQAHGRTVAEVAAATGLGHLVYSSIAGADRASGVAHLDSKGRIEADIRSLALPATVLRPVFFMENFTSLVPPTVVDGELVVNLGLRPHVPLQMVSVRDIGAVAAIALADPEGFLGRTLLVAGDSRTGPEIAAAFGKAAGMPARFNQVPAERLRAFDPEVAKMFAFLDAEGPEPADVDGLRALHSGLLTLPAWLESNRPLIP